MFQQGVMPKECSGQLVASCKAFNLPSGHVHLQRWRCIPVEVCHAEGLLIGVQPPVVSQYGWTEVMITTSHGLPV